MKNLLIIGAVGCAAYGLWLYTKNKNSACGCGSKSTSGVASSQPVVTNAIIATQPIDVPTQTDLEMQAMVEHYDASDNSTVAPKVTQIFVPGAAAVDNMSHSGWIV